MPVLMKRLASRGDGKSTARELRNDSIVPPGLLKSMNAGLSLLRECDNRACRSGWMKLWRSRETPVLEGKWACSPACMQKMVQAAIQRETGEANTHSSQMVVYQHRVPLGLVLLSRGAITQEQLRKAIESQKNAGTGRLGEWLIRQGATDEEQVARALSVQWNCPVLPVSPYDPAAMASTLPRLLMDSFGIVPLRLAGSELLYVAFEGKIDRSVVLAVERMLGWKVEAGVLRDSEFRRVRQEALHAAFPKTRLLEATNMRGLMHAFTTTLEERRGVRSQIVRVRDYYWLRIWRNLAENGRRALPETEEIEDMVCSIAG